jgi:hypothetical protein
MKLKSLIIATLISSQGHTAQINSGEVDPILRSSDFTGTEKIARQGSAVLRLNLTQTGIDKLDVLKKVQAKQKVTFEVNGKFFALKVRDFHYKDQLEVGPFSPKEAEKIAEELGT